MGHLNQKSSAIDIVQSIHDWAKSEMISSIFFMVIGVLYLLGALGLCQWGDSALANALVIPIMLAGGLLLGAGVSFYLSNKSLLTSFEKSYQTNPAGLINAEIERTERTIKTYEKVALKVFPAIILFALLISIVISNPTVRAISIAIIAFLTVLVILDSQALKRIKAYHQKLVLVIEDSK